MKLTNKIAVVTGAGSGVGRAIAIALGKEGALVFCLGRTSETLNETVRIIHESGGQTKALVCDVSIPKQVEEVFKTILTFGNVYILINNAAAFGDTALTEDQSVESWVECLHTNILGPAMCNKAVVPGMKAQKGGFIINISSLATTFAYTSRNPYGSTKHGLEGSGIVTAAEGCGYGICVNSLVLGHVEGDRIEEVMKARAKSTGKDPEVLKRTFISQYHLTRNDKPVVLVPEDVAEMVLFLTTTQVGSKITSTAIEMLCGFRL